MKKKFYFSRAFLKTMMTGLHFSDEGKSASWKGRFSWERKTTRNQGWRNMNEGQKWSKSCAPRPNPIEAGMSVEPTAAAADDDDEKQLKAIRLRGGQVSSASSSSYSALRGPPPSFRSFQAPTRPAFISELHSLDLEVEG